MVDIRLIAVSLTASSLAACGLAGCASSTLYTGADAGVHHFNQIGRRAPARQIMPQGPSAAIRTAAVEAAPTTPSASPSTPVETPVAPTRHAAATPHRSIAGAGAGVSLDEARRRVIALLSAEGFAPEPDAHGDVISASRMATANDGAGEAACGVRALNRPRMYAANVDVRLAPGATGVEVGVDARFEEMDQNLVSGELSKHACTSLGVLEAQVLRAAMGG
jgi:hypothetical protein